MGDSIIRAVYKDGVLRYRPSGQIEFDPVPSEGLVEIPLDTFDAAEINTSETTPLLQETGFSTSPALAEAGGILGTSSAVAAAPSGSAIAAGVGVAAGTIIAGTLAGTLRHRETDPVVSIPDHRYLGPGNTLDNSEPKDTDDLIAQEHDHAYDRAQTQEDILEADRNSANEFLTDALFNQNPHSVAGYIGLKAKETIERQVGVKYPANLPSISGMYERVRRAYDPHIDPRKQPQWPRKDSMSARQWASQVRYHFDQWNRRRQNLNLPRVEPPNRLKQVIGVTMRPPRIGGVRKTNEAISWSEFVNSNRGPLLDAISGSELPQLSPDTLNHILNDDTDDFVYYRQDPIDEIIDALDNPGGAIVSDSDFDDRDGAGPSGVQFGRKRPRLDTPTPDTSEETEISFPNMSRPNTRGNAGGAAMEVDAAPAATAAAAARATGHNSASDGGFDSAQGPESTLYKGGYSVKNGMLEFTKVHRIRTAAIPFIAIADGFRSGSILTSTPLAEIPWNRPYFYMSPEEFSIIPAGSYFKDCEMEIMQLVATTGYPTGGTEASVAQANHPKILCYADDLHKTIRGGVERTLTIGADMIPSAPAEPSPDDFILKQYGSKQSDSTYTVAGAAHDIPYYTKTYFMIYQPNRAQAKLSGFFDEETTGDPPTVSIINERSVGQEYFRNAIKQVNSNDTTWDSIGKRYYKFSAAPVGEQFQPLEIWNGSVFQATGSQNTYFNALRTVVPGKVNAGTFDISESITNSNYADIPIVTYKGFIEQGASFVRGDRAAKPARQPTFHIGMRAIDKFDPTAGTRSSIFVQASIEFCIKATIRVNLPAYPNRFIRPSIYTTGYENAAQGNGYYIGGAVGSISEDLVTFGLQNVTVVAPSRTGVDAPEGEIDENGIKSKGKKRVLPSANVTMKLRKRK